MIRFYVADMHSALENPSVGERHDIKVVDNIKLPVNWIIIPVLFERSV